MGLKRNKNISPKILHLGLGASVNMWCGVGSGPLGCGLFLLQFGLLLCLSLLPYLEYGAVASPVHSCVFPQSVPLAGSQAVTQSNPTYMTARNTSPNTTRLADRCQAWALGPHLCPYLGALCWPWKGQTCPFTFQSMILEG